MQGEAEELWSMAQLAWRGPEASVNYPSGCVPPMTWWRQALLCCWSLLVAACVVGMAILIGLLAQQRGGTSNLRYEDGVGGCGWGKYRQYWRGRRVAG